MRVFGKRGAQPRQATEGRSWWGGFRREPENAQAGGLTAGEKDILNAPAPDDLALGTHGAPTGALALIEQLSQEMKPFRAPEAAMTPTPLPEPARRDGGLSSLFDGFRGDARAQQPVREPEPFARRMQAPAVRAEDREVFSLLAELRNDINSLKQEQTQVPRPSLSSSQDHEVRSLLAELKSDIRLLKEEQKAVVRREESREVHDLLAMLRGDIVALKQETQSFGVKPSENNAVRNMLAALKGDIAALKEEQKSQFLRPEPQEAASDAAAETDVQQLLASLKQDILAVRTESVAVQPAPRVPTSEIGQMLATLKGDIDALKQEQHVQLNSWVRGTMKRANRAAEKEMLHLSDAAISEGDLSGARRMYNNAINEGSVIAILELARSFDPAECNQFGAGEDVTPDPERALALYRQAASRIGLLIGELGGQASTPLSVPAPASKPRAKRGKRRSNKAAAEARKQPDTPVASQPASEMATPSGE